MRPRRLRRLRGFAYTGPNRYSLTLCAFERRPLFHDVALAACVRTQILRAATATGYIVIVYCIMPDHVHLLVESQDGGSPLPELVKRAKQHSGFHGKRMINAPVWQPGYFDRVLREAEDIRQVVAYILDNPVRRGLVKNAREYPWSGSGVFALSELLDLVQIAIDGDTPDLKVGPTPPRTRPT